MVHSKGTPRRLAQRFSTDFAGRVKYSTLWPSRRDSPSDASRAMPTSGDFSGSANKGRYCIFAFCSPRIELQSCSVKRKAKCLVRSATCALMRWDTATFADQALDVFGGKTIPQKVS